MKTLINIMFFFILLSFNAFGNDFKKLPLEKILLLAQDDKIEVMELHDTEQNIEKYVYYAKEINKSPYEIEKFEKFEGDTLSRIRKKFKNTWWYFKVTNNEEYIKDYLLKIGNNKVSELHFHIFKKKKLNFTDTIGVNLKRSYPFFSPIIPLSLNKNDTTEILIYMPAKHVMLDMNVSINLNSSNLPITITSCHQELKSNASHFFGYGAFVCYFILYLIILAYLLNAFGRPLFRQSTGKNLRILFLVQTFTGGMALIATTGVLVKFLWDFSLSLSYSIESAIAYFDGISVSLFTCIFMLSSFLLFKRAVPVNPNVCWFKYAYYAVIVVIAINLIGTIFHQFLAVQFFWIFYDFRILSFIFCNSVIVLALLHYLIRTKNRYALNVEKRWAFFAFIIYTIVLCSIFYSILKSLQIVGNGIDNYKIIYSLLMFYASILMMFLIYRIEILKTKYASIEKYNKNRIAEREEAKFNWTQKVNEKIHDNCGPMFTMFGIKIGELENSIKDITIRKKLNEIPILLNKIQNKISEIISNESDSLEYGLTTILKKYINNLPVKINANFSISDNQYNNEDIIQEIICIAKELLNNCIKHSQSTIINFVLDEDRTHFILIIKDNGIGFDPKSINENRKSGLSNIKKRVLREDGSFFLDSKIGNGTLIEIKFPLDSLIQSIFR